MTYNLETLTSGISFLVKIHNEEATLDTAIRSLFELFFAYEILLILNRCTDASRQIAQHLQAERPDIIRILEYNTTVARPGYETLVTDANSTHSLPTYYNWVLQHRRYLWTAKWDADFVAPLSLRNYLNTAATAGLWTQPDHLIWLPAKAPTHDEYHPYFSSCLSHYTKQVFYEVPYFRFQPQRHIRHSPSVYIQHQSDRNHLKSYWKEPAWFFLENTTEAQKARDRYTHLITDFGLPPLGMGRSGDTDTAQQLGYKIIVAWPDYVSFLE